MNIPGFAASNQKPFPRRGLPDSGGPNARSDPEETPMKTPLRRLMPMALLALPATFPLSATAADGLAKAVDAEFSAMDANHNGRIAPAEHAEGAKKMFDTMDANRDGKVTAAEMDAAHAKITGRKTVDDSEMTSAEKIRMVDANRDGVLTATVHAEGAKKMFALMDLDTDGDLTKEEVLAGHQELLSKDDQ
jgi:hypothetical protein